MIRVRTSRGVDLGEYETVRGLLTLRPADETDIWAAETRALNEALARAEAMRSQEVLWDGQRMTLANGDPLTPKIMESWGWRETEDGWVTTTYTERASDEGVV